MANKQLHRMFGQGKGVKDHRLLNTDRAEGGGIKEEKGTLDDKEHVCLIIYILNG